jgi:hypothetical protein
MRHLLCKVWFQNLESKHGLSNLVMLSTDRPFSRMGRTCLPLRVTRPRPCVLSAPLAPRASRPTCVSCSHHVMHSLTLPTPLTSCRSRLAPHARLRTAEVRPLRRGIKLRAGIKLRVNERPLGAANRWAHVVNVCFYAFHMYVSYVLSGCFKSRSGIVYVAMTMHVCCKYMFQMFSCFKRMLQMFYWDVAYVALAIHVCCKCMFQILRLFQTYIASVLSECCICCSAYTYVSSKCYKCFICFKRMLLQMLLYCKCFMSRRGKGTQAKVVCSGAVVPACA